MGGTRVSQDQNPETGPQYFTIHDELDFDESGDERNHSYEESSIAGTVVTLLDGSTLSSGGGNQTSLTAKVNNELNTIWSTSKLWNHCIRIQFYLGNSNHHKYKAYLH